MSPEYPDADLLVVPQTAAVGSYLHAALKTSRTLCQATQLTAPEAVWPRCDSDRWWDCMKHQIVEDI